MDTTSVDAAGRAEQAAPTSATRASQAAPTNPRARLLWLLGRVGWGVLLGLGLFILAHQVFEVSQGPSDFCQDYLAARRLIQGVPVYLPLHCWAGSHIIFVPTPREYDTHAPSSALLFWPLGLLPAVLAAALWGLASLTAYLASGVLLLRALGWRSLRSLALFVLGSVFWEPFTFGERMQNLAQVALLLLVGSWLLERRRRPGWAGGLLGLAGLLTVWPAALLVLALFQRKWRLAWSGAATLLGGTLVSLAVLGPGAYAAYLGPVRANEVYWIPNTGNVSLVGALVRPFTGYRDPSSFFPSVIPGSGLEQAALFGEVVGGLLLAGTLFLLWRCGLRAQNEVVETLSLSLLITILLLAFPLTWTWGLMLLLLPVALLLLALRQVPRPPRWWLVVLGLSLLLLVDPAADVVFPGWLARNQMTGLARLGTLLSGLPTYGLVLFAAAQAWLLWRSCAPTAPRLALSVEKPALEGRSG